MTEEKKTSYKILFVGNGNVGKSTFLKRHKTGDFDKRYIATMGVEVHPLTFTTNKGTVILNIWDCAGDPRYRGLEDGYYIGADAAVIFFDVTDPKSYDDLDHWYTGVKRTIGSEAPIVLCGNKVDITSVDSPPRCIRRLVQPKYITFHIRKNIPYYDISARSNYNFEKPFLTIMRALMGEDLNFE